MTGGPVLHQFLSTHVLAIGARASALSHPRRGASPVDATFEHGVSVFLTQLSETLRLEGSITPFSPAAIGDEAAVYGQELLARGCTVSQVVHAYGDVCQAVTELALECGAPITVDEFHVMNRCLDTAIAEAVTAHAQLTAERVEAEEIRRTGQIAHEQRNLLQTALLAFQVLKQGTVAVNGNTGMVLGRSLIALRDLVETTLSDVRLEAGTTRPALIVVADLLDEVAAVAHLHAESTGVDLQVQPLSRRATVVADPQLLLSAVMNLVRNGLKFTPHGGCVVVRAADENGRVRIEVEDQCGGFPDSTQDPLDPFQPFRERRGRDRSGLGLGLSIARRAIRANGGEIHIRNSPGVGCVFVVDLPAPQEAGTP
jgi:signal transduction histidine kinase